MALLPDIFVSVAKGVETLISAILGVEDGRIGSVLTPQERARQRLERVRVAFGFSVLLILFGAAVYWARFDLGPLLGIGDIRVLGIASIAAISFGASSLFFIYLQTGVKLTVAGLSIADNAPGTQAHTGSPADVRNLQSGVERLTEEMVRLRSAVVNANLDAATREELVEVVKKSMTEESSRHLLGELKSQLGEAQSIATFDGSRRRLLDEVGALQRRGNLNLFFGSILTAGALYTLLTTIGTPHNEKWTADPWQLVTLFGPRIALAIFLQVFAFFFLKLYRASLSEIKYFQNEITNIESRRLALDAAMRGADSATMQSVVNSLLATERNHILTKDQTTVELEKARLDRDQRSEIIKGVTEFFQKKGS